MNLLDLPDELLAAIVCKIGLQSRGIRIARSSNYAASHNRFADVASPLVYSRVLLVCHRWLHLIRYLPVWPGLVEELSAALPFEPHVEGCKEVYEQLATLPEEWCDPRFDFAPLASSDFRLHGAGDSSFPLCYRWPGLSPQQQYASLINYHLKIEARFDAQIEAATSGLEQYFANTAETLARAIPRTRIEVMAGIPRTPEVIRWCRHEAVFYAVRWLILLDGWDNHGPAFTDALDMLTGGWKAVDWGDTVIREILHEAFEDHFRRGFASTMGEDFEFDDSEENGEEDDGEENGEEDDGHGGDFFEFDDSEENGEEDDGE